MTQEEREKKRKETKKMKVYKLHASEVDILEKAGEL